MNIEFRVEKAFAIVILLCMTSFAVATAGWHTPVRISDGYSYSPSIQYSNGVLHAIYQSPHDSVYYVRSTDLGETWSTPRNMMNGWSAYPRLKASGDTVIAMWQCTEQPFYRNCAYSISLNGGQTWSDTLLFLPRFNSGLGQYDFDISGSNIFFIYSAGGEQVLFKKSTDFGMNWSLPESLYSFYSLDNLELDSKGDTVILAMSGDLGPGLNSEVYFFKASDAGQSWGPPDILSLDDGSSSYKPVMSLDEDGKLGICWGASGRFQSQILLKLSDDYGLTWGPLIENADMVGWVDHYIACKGDTIHLVGYVGQYLGHTVSTDDGFSWATKDTIEFNRYNSYSPAIALSPGRVHVAWDDRRFHFAGIYYSNWEDGYIRPDSSVPPLAMIASDSLSSWMELYPNICVGGEYAYLAGANYEQYDRTEIINISNPAEPFVIGQLDTLHYPYEMEASGEYIYLASGYNNSLACFDVSDQNNPTLASEVNIPRCLALCRKDSLMFLLSNGGLRIYSISNPFQPYLVGVLDSLVGGWSLNDIAVENGIACLVGSGKMLIIDVSNPANPIQRARYTIDEGLNEGLKVAVKDNYAYVIVNDPRIEIVDISDPSTPTHAGWYYLNYGSAYNLCIRGNALLVAHSDLTVADISDPINPVTVSEYSGSILFVDVDADNHYIYGNGTWTFAVFQMPQVRVGIDEPGIPKKASLLYNYPNPFNAQTTISYSLSESCPVTLTIYNLLGQKVAVLFDGVQTAGEHKTVWDAGNQTSGIYFYRISAGRFNKSEKMLLLK
jgi:hypothetical protein